jgi:hypothetical protein
VLTDRFGPDANVTAEMVTLADSVAVSSQGVPQPFYFSRLPSGLGFAGAQALNIGLDRLGSSNYEIEFVEARTEILFALSDGISVGGSLVAGTPQSSGPAFSVGGSVRCENLADGWHLCVSVVGPLPADVSAQGGLTGLLGDATALDANRPQDFTTDVIR